MTAEELLKQGAISKDEYDKRRLEDEVEQLREHLENVMHERMEAESEVERLRAHLRDHHCASVDDPAHCLLSYGGDR